MDLAVELVTLPVRGAAAHWDYGTAVVGVPGTSQVLLTPPSAASSAPWALVDLATYDVTTGTGMPGPLRGAVFRETGAWWVAGLYGAGRLFPGSDRVTDVVREGLVRYPNRLVALGEHVVLGSDLTPNVSVLTTDPVARMRLARADASVPIDDGRVRVLAPRAGKAYDVDPAARRTVRRHDLVPGRGGRLVGTTFAYVAGPAGGPWRVRRVEATTLAELPGADLPLDDSAVEVLGTDGQGRVVVSRRDGFMLLDPASGEEVAQHGEPRPIRGAGMVPGLDAVALASGREPLGTVVVVRW